MRRILFLIILPLVVVAVKAQNEVWWSYYPQDITSAFATGDGVAQTYHVALRLPARYAMPDGGQLQGVRYRLSTQRVSNMKAWVATALPEGGEADLLVSDVQASDYNASTKMYELRFAQPVSVPADGCYVGVSFTVPDISTDTKQGLFDQNPIMYVQEEVAQKDAFYIRSDKYPYWENYGITGKSLMMQLLIGGELFSNAVRPMDFGTHQAVHGETVTVPITLCNFGTAPVSSIDYAIDTRSRKGQEQHFDLTTPLSGVGKRAVVELPFTTDSYSGNVKKTLRITKVNGQANECEAQATGALFELTRRVVPRLLFEEFTGTWCVNCPRGMVGLEKLHDVFGDRIVALSVHNGDPMAIEDYDFTMQLIKGYPSALINREYEVDPYFGATTDEPYGVRTAVDWLLQNTIAPAELDVEASWNSDSTGINITTRTTFLFDSNTANYALGYVLVADSLHGDGWLQKNGYASMPDINDPDLLPWTKLPEWVPDLRYNHVAIATSGVRKGLTASVKAPLKAEEAQTHTQFFSTADNVLVQDKRRLRVAVLLFDTQSGLVVNACQTAVPSADETGIVPCVALATQHTGQTFDLQGRAIRSLQSNHRPALHIERGADGTVRKVIKLSSKK